MTGSSGSAPQPFTLTFRSEMDPLHGGGFAYATIVRVAGDSGRAIMSINHYHPDLPKPIGLFAATLSPEARDGLASAMAGVKWAELPPPRRGDASGATLTFEFARGVQMIRRAFNSYNRASIQALGSVFSALEEAQTQLMSRPYRVLQLAIARTATGFRVAWQNMGTGGLIIADPREPVPVGAKPRVQVKVSPIPPPRPGWDPPRLPPFIVDLAPAPGPLSPITLAPGQTFELDTIPWKPAALGDYVARAGWIDYLGPPVDPDAVMEGAPDPNQVDDNRPYLLRGAACSNGVGFKAEKGR